MGLPHYTIFTPLGWQWDPTACAKVGSACSTNSIVIPSSLKKKHQKPSQNHIFFHISMIYFPLGGIFFTKNSSPLWAVHDLVNLPPASRSSQVLVWVPGRHPRWPSAALFGWTAARAARPPCAAAPTPPPTAAPRKLAPVWNREKMWFYMPGIWDFRDFIGCILYYSKKHTHTHIYISYNHILICNII